MHKTQLFKLFSILAILAFVFSNLQPVTVQAQSGDGLKRGHNAANGRVSLIAPEGGRALPAARALGQSIRPQDPAMALAKRYGSEFGLKDAGRELVQKEKHEKKNGQLTVKFQQQHENVPVMGGELIVNTNGAGDLYSINGEVSPGLSLSTQPGISAEEARQSALDGMAKWYQKTPEDFTSTEPQLWIYDESLLQPSTRPAELVWRMEVTAKDNSLPVRELVLINAQRGSVSLHFNQIDMAWGASNLADEGPSTPTPEPPQPTEPPVTNDVPESGAASVPSQELSSIAATTDAQAAELTGTWYVATTGSDDNLCTDPVAPCATINGAIGKAASDGLVKIASGTYTGSGSSVVTISKGITLSGGWDSSFSTQAGATIIDGEGVRNGIYSNASGVAITVDHFVVQNSHGTSGGGIYFSNSYVTISNSSIINNSADMGGGIFVTGFYLRIAVINSTISSNTADTAGGGIYVSDGTVSLRNSTVVYNHTNGSGGGVKKPTTTSYLYLQNSILAGNTAAGVGPDCSGNTASYYLLLGNTSGCTVYNEPGNKFNLDPLLNPSLSGILPLHTLQVGSPAIDAGDNTSCLASDQRGMPRPYGTACDMGAYEYALGAVTATSGSNQAARVSTSFASPFTVNVIDASLKPMTSTAVTFSAPASGASGVFAGSGTNVTTVYTNHYGTAVSPLFTANNQSGNYSVTATVSGLDSTAVFTLTNNGTLYVAATGSDSNSCQTTLLPCATINGAIGKAIGGDTVKIATGTYTGTGSEVILINKNISLSGGWNADFTAQSGWSTIDGQAARRGMTINSGFGVTVERFSIQNGYSQLGTGIYNMGGTLTLNDSVINGNGGPEAWARSGIFNNEKSIVTLNHSTISNNGGSGIYNSGSSYSVIMVVNNSTINNNSNTGIYNAGSKLTLNNTTLSGNQQGGLYTSGTYAEVTLNNSTVSGNTARENGGGIYRDYYNGPVTLKNSIVAGNTAPNRGPDCYGSINSAGYNLIGSIADCTFTASTGDLTNVDARLSALIGTPGYYPLRPDSPARDAGNGCLPTDVRGIARPVGARCDMGAYEYTAPGAAASLVLISGDGQHAMPGAPFSRPLQVMVVDGQGSPVPNVSVTFTVSNSGASGTFAATGTQTTTVLTDPGGLATTSILSANGVAGAFTVTASASGAGSVNFSLKNIAWYVATTGSDSNECQAPAAPCATVNAVLGKAGFSADDTIVVADGTYTGSGTEVILLSKSARITGGWTSAFTLQNGWSIIEGQNARQGIRVNGGISASLERFVIQNGWAEYTGGGLANGGALVVNTSTIRNNKAGRDGGGITNSGLLTISNSTIMDNQAPNDGGGVHNSFGVLNLNNTTVSGNTSGYGGGLYSDKTARLNNTTISANKATSNGGGLYFSGTGFGGVVTLQNTLLAGNQAGYMGKDCYAPANEPISSSGYNLIGNNKECPFTSAAGDLIGTNATPIDPRVSPLQNYGGPTFTHALLSGSPAIDAGNPAAPGSGSGACISTDQRGINRPFGTYCDIGALEFNGTGTTPTYMFLLAGSPQTITRGGKNPVGLQVLVVDEKGGPSSGVTVNFTAPLAGPGGTFSDTNTNTSASVTGADGMATAVPFIANTMPGPYEIVATIEGIAGSVSFQITNSAPPVRTYTANYSSTLPGSFICDETDIRCTYGRIVEADMAHLYAIGTSEFYSAKLNRAGIDQNYMPVISTVYYCSTDPYICPFSNAFWSGAQMVYGNAYGYTRADDVVAHELTHGVTQYESNLFYYYQSGAINESFSDLWGEYYDQSNGKGNDADSVKWILGEDIANYPVPSGFTVPAMRSMSNPPALRNPDKMSSTYYYEGDDDNGGVHWNSGVNNKAVYLMVDGGIFNGRTITALGWDKVSAIYYEVNTNLLTSGADYSDLYYALQQACTTLVGQKGITTGDCIEVKDALDAVEMNGQPAAGYNPNAPLCTTAGALPGIFFADDLENGTGNWTFTNGAYTRWQYDSPYGQYAQSGQHFLYADDYPGVVADARAQLKAVTIPANAYLWFAHAYDFEYDSQGYYDGGVLEYSTNGGSTWIDAGSLIDSNGYKGTLSASYSNPLGGKKAFVGTSHGYISTRLNLATLAGKKVSFRWRMGLDKYYSFWGWWLDNVKLYTCNLPLKVSIGGNLMGSYYVQPREVLVKSYTGIQNGPVKVSSTDNSTLYASERVVSGNSFNEVMGYPTNQLTTEYWFPWYDNIDMTTWVLVGNPTTSTAAVDIYIGGVKRNSYTIAAGKSITPRFPLQTGPVRVVSTNGVKIFTSERTQYGPNHAFNEVMAYPSNQFATEYWFPWYDNSSMTTWVLVGNPSTTSAANVAIYVAGQKVFSQSIPPGGRATPRFNIPAGGPVRVVSTNGVKIFTSERVIYGDSFNEVMGYPGNQLTTEYWYPWYDNVSMSTWVLVGNPTSTAATVEIYVGDVKQGTYTVGAGKQINQRYAFNTGPVRVLSTNGVKIFSSERVLYGTSFNEVMGYPGNQLATEYWFPWYDSISMSTDILVGRP